jgi:hypothetical protein
MLQHMKLDHRFWAKAMAIATYIHNQIPTKTIFNMTQKKVWCGYKPSINHLHVFGHVAFGHVPKGSKDKIGFQRCQMHIH